MSIAAIFRIKHCRLLVRQNHTAVPHAFPLDCVHQGAITYAKFILYNQDCHLELISLFISVRSPWFPTQLTLEPYFASTLQPWLATFFLGLTWWRNAISTPTTLAVAVPLASFRWIDLTSVWDSEGRFASFVIVWSFERKRVNFPSGYSLSLRVSSSTAMTPYYFAFFLNAPERRSTMQNHVTQRTEKTWRGVGHDCALQLSKPMFWKLKSARTIRLGWTYPTMARFH